MVSGNAGVHITERERHKLGPAVAQKETKRHTVNSS